MGGGGRVSLIFSNRSIWKISMKLYYHYTLLQLYQFHFQFNKYDIIVDPNNNKDLLVWKIKLLMV